MYFKVFPKYNSPYIKLAFYSVAVRQGTYTRCRITKKNGKMKTQKKVKRKKRQMSFTIQLELVSCLFISRFHSLPNESIDHIYYSPIYLENYPIFTTWTKNPICPLNVVDFLARSHRTKKSRLGRAHEYWLKEKKKEINDTKDRSTVNFDSNESWLTNIQFVNEARSQPDLIQIILNAMCHIKFDVNYLLKPLCLFTR